MKIEKDIATVLASITDQKEMSQFLEEMFTLKEMKDLALRWQLLCDLYLGESQRRIAAEHGMSLCKITRGSKVLKQEEAVTRKILETIYGGDDEPQVE